MEFQQALKLLNDVCKQVTANFETHQAMQLALLVIQKDHDRLVQEVTAAVELAASASSPPQAAETTLRP